MRRLIFRPLVMMLTFTVGLFVTFLFTFMGDALTRLFDEPAADIPALCRTKSTVCYDACAQPDMREIEQYAIYSLLLNKLYHGGHTDRLLIQDRTSVGPIAYKSNPGVLDEIKQQLPLMQEETLLSFLAANEQPHRFDKHFPLPGASRFIESQQLDDYFSKEGGGGGGWNAFHRDYPHWGGFITVSKVGFNQDMNQALLYFSSACADTCGSGGLIFLVKEGVVWRIKGTAATWIS